MKMLLLLVSEIYEDRQQKQFGQDLLRCVDSVVEDFYVEADNLEYIVEDFERCSGSFLEEDCSDFWLFNEIQQNPRNGEMEALCLHLAPGQSSQIKSRWSEVLRKVFLKKILHFPFKK